MTLTRNWTLSLIGLELLLAGGMAIGYIVFIQPTAPRYHQAAAAKVIAPVPPVPVPTAIETISAAPAAVIMAPVIVAPVTVPPTALAHPKVTPAKPRASPAAPAAKILPPVVLPTPVPSPIPTRIPTPVPVKPSPDELIRRGMVSLNAGEWPSAMESFDAARKLQPNNPDLGYLSGMALENLGQPGAAIDAFRSCTSGPYAQIAKGHVKTLVSKLKH